MSLGHPLSPRRKAHGVKPTVKNPRERMHGEKTHGCISYLQKNTHPNPPSQATHSHTLTHSLMHPPTQAPTHTGTYSLLTCLLTHRHIHIPRTTCLTRTYTGQTGTGLTCTGLTCTGLTGIMCVYVCVYVCVHVCDIVSGCVCTCVCEFVCACV